MKRVGIVCDRRVLDDMAVHQVHDEYIAAVRDGVGALPLLVPSTDTPLNSADLLAAVDGLLFTGAVSNVAPSHYGGDLRPGTELDEIRDATTLPLESATVRSRKFRRPLKPCRILAGSGLVVVEPSGRWMTCVIVIGLA